MAAARAHLREILKSGYRRVERGTEEPWLSFGEFSRELRLVEPNLGLSIQKSTISARSRRSGLAVARSGDGIEDQGTGGLEDGLIAAALQFPSTERPPSTIFAGCVASANGVR